MTKRKRQKIKNAKNFVVKITLPLGFIVGKAKLVDVKKYDNEEELNKDKNFHLADNSWGNYGFILENTEKIEKIECKGKLGFWELRRCT